MTKKEKQFREKAGRLRIKLALVVLRRVEREIARLTQIVPPFANTDDYGEVECCPTCGENLLERIGSEH